jgi:SAM-dependent methyltransferase
MTRDTIQRSWSRLMKWRTECHQRFGPVQSLPIRFPNDELQALLTPDSKVLDVGAGATKPFLKNVIGVTPCYFSLDTDPDGEFEFQSFDDIPDNLSFDIALANQVIEHLYVDDAFNMVNSAFRHLRDGGHLIATVPNAAHPVRHRDCTHVTAWPSNDLYSLLRSAGFHVVTMARYNKAPLTTDPLKRWVVETVCQEFRVDWCDSLMAVGRKQRSA